jgi:hypothetical protein
MNTKNYVLVNKNTGKQWRKAATREEARQLKASKGYKHAILNLTTNMVVR